MEIQQLLPIGATIVSFAVAAGFAAWVSKQQAGTKATKMILAGTGGLTLGSVAGTGTGAFYSGAITSSGVIKTTSGTQGQLFAQANAEFVTLRLQNQTPATGATWELNSYQDGNLYLAEVGVNNWLTMAKTTGAATFAGVMSIVTATRPQLKIQGGTAGGQTIHLIQGDAGGYYNWLIGSQYNVANTFEITPSTAADGTTFSTPA